MTPLRPVLWMLPLMLAFAAFKLLAPKLRGVAGEAQVGRALERLFPEVRHDLILPDGRDGRTQIDHPQRVCWWFWRWVLAHGFRRLLPPY